MNVVSKHQPIFSQNRYSTRISEESTPGTLVLTVRASSNTDGVIGYRIINGDLLRKFAIDFNKGKI